MPIFTLRPQAQRDAAQIAFFLEAQQPGLADRFAETLDDTYATIIERPRSFPVVARGVRRARAEPFKVAVFFTQPDERRIEVLAILDLRRDPATIRKRLR